MNPASTTAPATMSATSTPSTIRCALAPGISSCTSTKTRAVLAASMTIAAASAKDRESGPLASAVGVIAMPRGVHSARIGCVRGSLGDAFGPGLSVAISAALRFPLRSLSPPVAGAPCALRLPGKRPGPRIDPQSDVPGTTAEGGGAWNKQILLRRDGSLCHTCSLRQPRRRRGPPLRCAPLRPGLGMKRR